MTHYVPHNNPYAPIVCNLGMMSQMLISRSLDLGLVGEVKQLQRIDEQLWWLLMQHKMFGRSTHYIWRTQDDKKVRSAHASNDDQIFEWDNPPATGHPGEDFNCRCWAEPLGAKEYANQLLISKVNDNPDKRTNTDFAWHYLLGNGVAITLQETGYLGDVIEHFGEVLAVYNDVNEQIIQEAINNGEGPVPYNFNNIVICIKSYSCYTVWYELFHRFTRTSY